jgi:hypothetical protein
MMDSPILPEREGDEEGENSRKLQPRHLSTPYALRTATAVVVLAGSVVGLVSRLEARHTSAFDDVPVVQAVSETTTIYGQPVSPAALKPGKANQAARSVCNEQVRFEPTTGHWHCVGWAVLGTRDIGAVARDPGGPCTHRLAGMDSPVWKCETKLPVPKAARFVGRTEHGVIFGGMRDGSDFCSEEARNNTSDEAWQCTNWRPIPPGFRFVEAAAPSESCTFRVADQQTGEWSCNPPYAGN